MLRLKRFLAFLAAILLCAVVVVFVLENLQRVQLAFLGWQTPEWPLVVFITLSFVLGGVIGLLLSILAAVSLVVTLALVKVLGRLRDAPSVSLPRRLLGCVGLVLLALLAGLLVDQETPRGQGGNTYARELASNGPYQFFAAFRNNELDYPQFYDWVRPMIDAEYVEVGTSADMTWFARTDLGQDKIDAIEKVISDHPIPARP